MVVLFLGDAGELAVGFDFIPPFAVRCCSAVSWTTGQGVGCGSRRRACATRIIIFCIAFYGKWWYNNFIDLRR